MEDRATIEDIQRAYDRSKGKSKAKGMAADKAYKRRLKSLEQIGLEISNREQRNIRDNELRTIGEATSDEGADAIDQIISKGSEKRRRVKPGEEKKQGFSMGGMADYIKDLL